MRQLKKGDRVKININHPNVYKDGEVYRGSSNAYSNKLITYIEFATGDGSNQPYRLRDGNWWYADEVIPASEIQFKKE